MRLLRRLQYLVRPHEFEADLAEELKFHRAMKQHEFEEEGLPPLAAERAAQRALGSMALAHDQSREVWIPQWLDSLWRDVTYAVRQMRHQPVFTLSAVFTLALGIGANTAIFTLINNVLLKWLPVKDPQQLVMLGSGAATGSYSHCYENYTELRDHNAVFSGLLARNWWEFYFSTGQSVETLNVELVSGNYYQLLGVNAYIGRTLTPEDDGPPGTGAVAVLNYDFWISRFGGDRNAIGRTVLIQGHPFTIVGVTPPDFFGINAGITQPIHVPWSMAKVLLPNSNPFDEPGRPHYDLMHVIGRLKPGISIAQAEASLAPLYANIRQVHGDALGWKGITNRQQFLDRKIGLYLVGSGFAGLKVRFGLPLEVLMALVGVLLLIACTTLANLMLARNSVRHREMAVRMALGAGRGHLIRQSLVETLLLSLAGGVVGVLIARWGAGALVSAMGPSAAPQFDRTALSVNIDPDWMILAFTLAVSVLTGILFGLAPSFQASRTPVIDALKGVNAGLVASRSQVALRKGLIAAQVALCLALVTAAGLFVRTLQSLRAIDTGVDVNHLAQISVNPDPYLRSTPEQREAYYRQLQQRLQNLPGVRSAARSKARFLVNDIIQWRIAVEGIEDHSAEDFWATSNAVSSTFFETAGIPLIAGRVWTPEDDYRPATVAVVSQSFARFFFGDRSPLGHLITRNLDEHKYQIIGVVADSKYGNARDDEPRAVYVPPHDLGAGNLLVRTIGNPRSLLTSIERETRALNRDAYVFPPLTLEKQADELFVQQSIVAWLAGCFGVFAGLMAAIGLYGVIAFSVAQRTSEIGIRAALGATRARIGSMVLREVVTLAGIGVAIGVPLSLVASRTIASLLFGVKPADPLTIGGSAILMCAIALAAGYAPARRAVRLDPMSALRHE